MAGTGVGAPTGRALTPSSAPAAPVIATTAGTPGSTIARVTFGRMQEAAGAAEATCGSVRRHFSIGGSPLELCFAGPALLPLARALEHLSSVPADGAALRVQLWDTASSEVPAVPLPRDVPAVEGNDGLAIRSIVQQPPLSMSLFSPQPPEAVYWIRDAGTLTLREHSSPLREILHWWQWQRGRQLVHAGAVAVGEDGVLIAGVSGSGKSTSTLACLLEGLDYVGDDHVLLADEGEPTIYSVYNTAKLHPDHARTFPRLWPHIANPEALDVGKALWFVQDLAPERLRRRIRAKAVVVPRVGSGWTTRFQAISPGAALLALAPSTIIQLRGVDDRAFAWMARFVARLPCYRLELGREPASIADAVRELIAR